MARRKPVPQFPANGNSQQSGSEAYEYTPTDGNDHEDKYRDSTATYLSDQNHFEIDQNAEQMLPNRNSVASYNTTQCYDSDVPSIVVDGSYRSTSVNSHAELGRPSSSYSQPPERYEPGRPLARITSGETLKLDERIPTYPPSQDPFADPQGQLVRPYSQYSQDSSSSHSLPHPYSNSSHEHLIAMPFDLPPNATPEPEPLRAGYDGIIDHFQHDTEAYASGNYRRASYRPPRSRSPTPAVEDEDYMLINNNVLQYTGYLQSPDKADSRKTHGDYQGIQLEEEEEEEETLEGSYEDGEKSPGISMEPETPVETRHFGPAPIGRVRRRLKKKRVQLTNGNLVVDLNVPPKLVLPYRGEPEMVKTRYTAVTCDPDDFEKEKFFLRQNEYGRSTELFIVITMYNEDEVLFCRTMYGVMRNISHLCSRKNSQTWGPDAWKKIVVCIVADGRKKIHPRVLDCLTLLGVYQPGDHMKNLVNNKAVTAHLFEYTTSFALDPDLRFKYPDKGIVPTQIIFCMKEKNQKKINSHRWFFNAFGAMLQPNVCVLLDVGTRPGNNSIYRLWKTFDVNSNVGGACGEIAVYKGKNWKLLLNPLVAAQNFEYKISNILDKPTENMFGYISVLPGAFSAYRYIALQNSKDGQGPLASYFKGEVLHGRDTDIFTSNMYLAEDRILCFELIAKANSNWVLKYVKGAIGETDVPEALPEFISQRRRWLNGSFFAAVYAIAHVGQIMQSGHSFSRKVILAMETVYNIINMIFTWFSIGNFYLFFVVLSSSLESKSFGIEGIKYFNAIAQYCMASIIIACFLLSMGNKPKASHRKYMLVSILMAMMMVYLIVASVLCGVAAISQSGGAVMLFSVAITYGVYAFSSLLAFDPWHMITSFIQYLLLSPTYINILNIYAYSNLDDISWGTKQDAIVDTDLGAVMQDSHSQVDVEMLAEAADANGIYEEALENLKYRKPTTNKSNVLSSIEKEQAAKDYYANVRTNVLLTWVLSNGLLLLAILGGADSSATFNPDAGVNRTKGYLTFILAFSAITNIIRFLGSILYLLTRVFTA